MSSSADNRSLIAMGLIAGAALIGGIYYMRSKKAAAPAKRTIAPASSTTTTEELQPSAEQKAQKKVERTFVALKPDAVERKKLGAFIKKFEVRGFKLVGLKLMNVPRELAEKHYAEHKGKPFYDGLVDFFTSSPLVAMVFEGDNVIAAARKIIGETKPITSPSATIRGHDAVDVGRNLIHGSDSAESAEREIALWFEREEIISWNAANFKWIYEKSN